MSNNKKHICKWLVVLGLMLCVYFPFFNFGTAFVSIKQVVSSWFPSDEDYKLKFVSVSLKTEEAIGNPLEAMMPVEVLSFRQSGEYVVVETHPQSVVVCPISAKVQVDEKNKTIKIESFGYTVELSGFAVLGVKNNNIVSVGRGLGTLATNELYLKISKGNKIFGIEELREMF